MSFILDALKKIEQDKRRADDVPAESIAVSASRLGARQPVLAMVAIAVGSALLTAAVVSFLSGPGAVDSTPEAVEPSMPPPRVEASTLVDVDEPAPEPASEHAPVVREASARVENVEPDREPEPARAVPVVTVTEDAPLEDGEADVQEGMQPIRIVGRERALLETLSIDERRENGPDAIEDDTDVEEPVPDDFPDLVLQGTSMIGTDAVAVISDQRVFEGDRIEGALVIRIGEREVELELDGRRFTLRL